jgi:MFS family permease
MTASHLSPGTKSKPASIKKVAAASFIGTSFEFYDHYIYGAAAAIVLPKLFFPESTPWTALLLSFATYGVAFASRPLGAAIFGHFGDTIGRKNILVATLLIMGLATFGIGLLPTYAEWGVAATAVLVVLRFVQGLALGGEWGGAALMVNEFDPEGRRRGFLGGLVQAASPVGLLLANGVFSLVTWMVSPEAFFSWGWRVPFLASAVLVVVGLYIRTGLSEPAIFAELDRSDSEPQAPIMQVLTQYPKELVLAVGSRVGSDIAWYVFSLFLLVYLPQKLGLPASIGFAAIVIAAAVEVFGVPFFGAMSDRFGRRPVLLFGAIGGMIWGFVYFWLLDTKSPTLIVMGAVIGMSFHAALWAPLASFIPEMFPTRVRWTGASLGFQLAGLFGGALAPIIATTLVAVYSTGYPVAIYLAVGMLVIIISVLAARETSDVDLRDIDARRKSPAASKAASRA